MRKLLIILLSFFFLNVCAQKNMSLEQVKSQWSTRNLKMAGGEKANILQFVQVFQNAYPTYSGGELIKFSKSKVKYENNDKVIDLKNGYALYSEDDPDSDNDEQLNACVWKRSNGHKLYALNLHRFSTELDVLCFYDYNPQTETLTPEKKLSGLFTPSFPGYKYRVFLPQNGKDLVIEEFFGYLNIKHTFSWDGMQPVKPQTTIERMDSYQATFSESFMFTEEHPLTKYALSDVDLDGFPELFFCSDDETYMAVFAVKLTMDLLAGQDDRRELHIFKGAVSHAGTCGAGCMSENYCFLKKSSEKKWLTEMSEVDFETGEYGPNTYKLNGQEISSSEAEKMTRSLGEPMSPQFKWKKIVR